MERFKNILTFSIFLFIALPSYLCAALMEQIVVSPLSSSMGNAVTAYPEGGGGYMVHYNPAALSFMGTRCENTNGYMWTFKEVHLHSEPPIDLNTGEKYDNIWAPFGGWFNRDKTGQGRDPWDGTYSRQSSGFTILPLIDFKFPYVITGGQAFSFKPSNAKYSRWSFGMAPMLLVIGGGGKVLDNNPLSYSVKEQFLGRFMLLTPAAAYRVSDTLSVGAMVGIGPSLFMADRNARACSDMAALTGALGEATEDLEIPYISEQTLPPPWFGGGINPYHKLLQLSLFAEDYITTSFNIGVMWKPYDWFAYGACYQSASESSMEGPYIFTYGPEFRRVLDWNGRTPMTVQGAAMLDQPIKSLPYQKGTVTIDVTWPARFQTGIMFKPSKQITLTCDLMWTDWAAWRLIKMKFDQRLHVFRVARSSGYKWPTDTAVMENYFTNTWHFGYGCEIKPTDKFYWRLGYERRPTSATKEQWWGSVPMSDISIYSTGVGFVFNPKPKPSPKSFGEAYNQATSKPNEIFFAVSYIKFDDKTVPAGASKNLNSISFIDSGSASYAGLEYNQKQNMWWFALDQITRW